MLIVGVLMECFCGGLLTFSVRIFMLVVNIVVCIVSRNCGVFRVCIVFVFAYIFAA